MTAPPEARVLDSWSPEGRDWTIEYDRGVFDDIRILVVDGFNKVSHGGVEVGGVLFGDRERQAIRIRAFRELRIQYRTGPSFTLSADDELALAELLSRAPADPDLAGLEPLGWFHSHTRSDIHLSPVDLALHERFFPEPWQVALVLKPERWDPVRAAFFVRDTNGVMPAGAVGPELELVPTRIRVVPDEPPAPLGEDPGADDRVSPSAAELVPAPDPPRKKRRLLPFAAIAALLAVAAGGLMFFQSRRNEIPLQIQLEDANGQLRISWNRAVGAVQRARSAALEITDGDEAISLPLTREQVQRGALTYVRNSRTVTVRLKVQPENGAPVGDFASFVGSPVDRAAEPAPPEPTPVEAQPPPQREAVADPPREAAERIAPEPLPTRLPPRRFRLPPPARRAGAEMPLLSDAPRIGAAGPAGAPPLPLWRSSPRLPAPEAEAPPQRRTGRIIWTGQWRRREYLAIDGAHSSTGFLNGELPRVPVKIRVFPADLTEDGLRLYTTDSSLRGKVELPGAQNGWNRTRFEVDPRIAGGVRVIESPGPQNDWKRLVLQSIARDESAIVIQWETP